MTNLILTLELPWPDKRLSPNARVHRMVKAEAAKTAREIGYYKVKEKTFIGFFLYVDDLECVRQFYPPDNRRRDIDNLGAMMKSYQDGIFDALNADDSQIVRVVNEMHGQRDGGKVIVILRRIDG